MGKPRDKFYCGALVALQIIDSFGEDTIFDEVVGSIGRDELIAEARRNGDMRLSGMSKYLKRTKESRRMREP